MAPCRALGMMGVAALMICSATRFAYSENPDALAIEGDATFDLTQFTAPETGSRSYSEDLGVEDQPTEATPQPRSELIRERYPSRAVKIERQVVQDANDNFLNHGKWKMWDPSGNLTAEGHYRNGERHGTWLRWFRGTEAKIFATVPFKQFRGPYVSQAEFKDGKLQGQWTIFDSKQRKISEWGYADGERHGKWIWWLASGRKLREIDYEQGDVNGQIREWSQEGKLVVSDAYQKGRKLARKATDHKGGKQKKTEGMYLHAKTVPDGPDDWWNGKLAPFVRQGKDERHGAWSTWYASGQLKDRGQFDHDVEIGTFTWWHINGQKATVGKFEQGERTGEWTWWHETGQKSIQGEYAAGGPSGRWIWWQEDGKVAQRADYNGKGRVVDRPKLPAIRSQTPQQSQLRPRFRVK